MNEKMRAWRNDVTRYALISLVDGLIMPVLLSATAILAFLSFSGFALAEFWKNWDFLAKASIVCALFMPYILPLLFSLLAGWLLTSRRTLPATLADRYIPLLLLPLLISLVVLSFYPSLISQCLYPALLDPRRGPWLSDMLFAAAGWFLFALGAFWGARKSAPAQERVRGLARMAGYIGLTLVIVVTNMHGTLNESLLALRDDFGKEILLPSYFPCEGKNPLATPATPPSLHLTDNYPLIDGDRNLLPLYGAIVQAVYAIRNPYPPETTNEASQSTDELHIRDIVDYTASTELALEELTLNEIDVAFGDMPAAKRFLAGTTVDEVPELTPVAREALVFFVHADNPVTTLNLEQIQEIYAGKALSWEDVGGPETEILAFQSDDKRTQQALKDMVMHGRATACPANEKYAPHRTAAYRNRTNALGYDFRWRANKRFPNGEIRFLRINGIAPTPENIRSGAYPLSFSIVMATGRSPCKEVSELRNWICGPEGQALINLTGFVSISGGMEENS